MKSVIFVILCVGIMCQADFHDKNSTSSSPDRILSRRKRYLIFPEGSSLQLVYCLTMPVIGHSTIFTIGGTAALAWELPHDPFQPYRKPAELLHRKDPPEKYTIKDPVPAKPAKPPSPVYLGNAPLLSINKYRNPSFSFIRPRPVSGMIQQPVRFPSINHSPSYNRYRYHNNYQRQPFPFANNHQQQFGYSKQPVYYRESSKSSTPSRTSSPPSIYHQVHRRTRRDLYGKLEKFLSAQSKDGKACLLKAICEVHQRSGEKGSFMEEVMKAVFRVKPVDEHQNEDVYDHAANKSYNCTEKFPTCDSSLLHFM